jgi:hypothetical protein
LLAKLNIAIWKAIDSGQLSEDVVSKLKELVKPENLRMAVAFIAAYAAAHASPIAPGLAILDAYFLGSSATEVGGVLWQLYLDLDSATTEQELNAAAASLSKVLAGPIADGLLKVLMVGAGKGAGQVAGEFQKRYQFQLPNGIKNGSRLNSGPPVPKIIKRDKAQGKLSQDQVKNGVKKDAFNTGLRGTDFTQKVRLYIDAIERHTGFRLHSSQRMRLADKLRTNSYQRLSTEAGEAHRRLFTQRMKNSQIAQWEQHTGQKWPRYLKDVRNAKGKVIAKKGQPYDAHHVIENIYGGPHEWWNLTPARFPDQHQGSLHLNPIMDILFP